jgi:putative dimethyl sulfoxide reductase chaperone
VTLAASVLDLVEQARRRARLAGLLGQLLLEEPGPGIADLVSAIPSLAPLASPDAELAVEYERLFLRMVPLHESVFLGNDGQRGGPIAAAVVELYREHDYDESGRWRAAGADHLGLELRCYAALCAEEADGWQGDRPDRAARAVEAERAVLAGHLGLWAEVAMAAVARRAGQSPYGQLAAAVRAFVAEEADRLRPAPDHPGMPAVAVDEPPHRLGPKQVARWLLSPAKCGGYLDADDIGAAALELGIPWRPSDGRGRLHQVVEAAVDGGDLHELLSELRPDVECWAEEHAGKEAEREGDRRSWRAWRLRAENTLALIDRMASPSPDAAAVRSVRVRVSGPTEHDRAAMAVRVMGLLRPMAFRVAVSMELAGDLAADIAALLNGGAGEVLVAGFQFSAIACGGADGMDGRVGQHVPDAEVVIELAATAGPLEVSVHPDLGPTAEAVQRALEALTAPPSSWPAGGRQAADLPVGPT